MSNLVASDVVLFRQLFFHRQDVFAEMFKRRQGDRAGEIGYSPACSNRWDKVLCNHGKCRQCRNFAATPLTDEIVMEHFRGEDKSRKDRTIGTYLVSPQGTVNLCVLDVDIDKAQTEHIETYRERVKKLACQLYGLAKHHGLNPVLEFSGNKGWHIWMFFDSPIPAAKAQALGTWLASQAEHFEGLHVETFPKQETIDQFGNLVKVPLGLHLKTGKRCYFADPTTLEVTAENQLDILRAIKPVPADTIAFLFEEYEITPKHMSALKSGSNGSVPKGARLPCVPKMWAGVNEGCRDEVAFRLAVHQYYDGTPKGLAGKWLCQWDGEFNDPPLGEDAIWEKVESAYKGEQGYGCSNDLIKQFCESTCSKYKYRNDPAPIEEKQVRNSHELCFLKVDPIDSSMIFCRSGHEYRCTNPEVRKEGVRTAIELRYTEKVIHKDILNLTSSNRRKNYTKEAVELGLKMGVTLDYQAILNDLTQLEEGIRQKEKEVFAALEAEKGARYVMSTEEEAKALELLKSPKLLWRVRQVLDQMGVVGEDINKLVIYLGYTSRLLPEPIQILVKGESSSGKSYVTRKTLNLFPSECYTELTDMTPQALFYIKEKDLRHHILLVFEKHGGEKADYTIRTTQSEGILRIWVVTKDKETNEMMTKEVTVQGPVMFLLTTTEAMIHAENETRNISLFSDDSKDQTRAIRSMAVKQYLLEAEEINPDELLIWHNAQRLLKPYQVRIPYVAEIDAKFPLEPVRVRRDFHRFIALIKTVAIFHQYQRTVTEIRGKPTIEATVGDYYIAKKLAEKVFAQAIIELGPKSIEVWRYCFINKYQADGITPNVFTYASVAEGMGWRSTTVRKWTYPLAEAGFIRWLHEGGEKNAGGKGKQARWELTEKTYAEMNVLPEANKLIVRYPALAEGIYDPITGETPDDALPF